MTVDDNALVRIESIIQSMTEEERQHPEKMSESRMRRIAKGAGRTVAEVQDLLNRFHGMRKMMAQIGKAPGLLARLPGFKQLAQSRMLKDVKMEDILPMVPRDTMPGQKQGPRRVIDLEKRRRKEKLARLERKKQRRLRKKK